MDFVHDAHGNQQGAPRRQYPHAMLGGHAHHAFRRIQQLRPHVAVRRRIVARRILPRHGRHGARHVLIIVRAGAVAERHPIRVSLDQWLGVHAGRWMVTWLSLGRRLLEVISSVTILYWLLCRAARRARLLRMTHAHNHNCSSIGQVRAGGSFAS
ncbi:hypothetical protein D3C72_1605850 [compost metagenome]